MRYLSVCSGIEAASVAWQPLGWTAVAFSEIDRFPCAVLAHHYPSVPNWGDLTKFREWPDATIDLLVGGTPCQSFSVAGLRAGLADPRGNLMFSYIGVLERYRPSYFVWENVPGVLSDETEALTQLLDAAQDLGYVIDVDILDAQHHGLAQRRERVFVCGQLASDIAKQRTISSALTVVQCLTESLLLASAVLSDQLRRDSSAWAFDATEPRRSLQKRMRLFALDSDGAASMLAANLTVLQQWCERERGAWDSAPGSSHLKTSEAIGYPASKQTAASCGASLSTEPSWKPRLDESLRILSACITSTAASETTDRQIYTCAQLCLHIARRITPSMSSSPTFWSAASSILTALRAFIDYATSESNCLFTDVEWIQPWADFVRQAAPVATALGNIGVVNFGQVLPVSESLSGHPAPRREAGESAPTHSSRRTAGGGLGTDFDFDCDGGLVTNTGERARALTSSNQRLDYETETLIAHSLRADGFDASEDGTGRGTPLITTLDRVSFGSAVRCETDHCDSVGSDQQHARSNPYTLAIRGRGDSSDLETRQDGTANAILTPNGGRGGIGVGAIAFSVKDHGADAGAISPTLRAGGHNASHANGGVMPAIAFDARQSDVIQYGDHSGPLDTDGHTIRIQSRMQVRRLTPRECCRLQGFPDDYLDILYRGEPASDGPKYKALGNSMAVPVVRWIGQRIALVEQVCVEQVA